MPAMPNAAKILKGLIDINDCPWVGLNDIYRAPFSVYDLHWTGYTRTLYVTDPATYEVEPVGWRYTGPHPIRVDGVLLIAGDHIDAV